jgi:DNA-binding FadR family transcriptional regulator
LQKRYLESIEKEHQVIVNAISARSPRKARDAMRRHLLNGKERYKQLSVDPVQ